MSIRLQVLLEPEELADIRRAAKAQHQTVSEWVRGVLRQARRSGTDEKLRALREAVAFDGPTGDIEQMNREIESGYLGSLPRG